MGSPRGRASASHYTGSPALFEALAEDHYPEVGASGGGFDLLSIKLCGIANGTAAGTTVDFIGDALRWRYAGHRSSHSRRGPGMPDLLPQRIHEPGVRDLGRPLARPNFPDFHQFDDIVVMP